MRSIDDYRQAFIKSTSLDPAVVDYVNGGASNQPRDNEHAFQNYLIRPYRVSDTSNINLSSTMLGYTVELPLCIAPMGNQCRIDSRAEHITATAAFEKGIGFTMSAWASVKMEDLVTNSTTGLKFLNLYIYKKRHWTEYLVRKAEDNGFHGLVLGFPKSNPTEKSKLSGGPRYANLTEFTSATNSSDPDYPLADHNLSWTDVAWLKSITKLPIIIKGILSAREAIQAVHVGAEAVIISNHGGRQLSSVPAPVDVLPEVVAAVGNRCEVYMDGGVYSGLSLFKALALGAKAVFLGRPVIWGMAYGGVEGVKGIIDVYRDELRNAMNLAGISDVNSIQRDVVVRRDLLPRL